ncbi:MAG: TlpA family protein disulfide reductase [Carboxylicivirga sp.]|jgi:thiol-disulfide isomerase/thioredoxin|nr:TlpA family protein disulfide reductase [Carboxylicivirga sp.]
MKKTLTVSLWMAITLSLAAQPETTLQKIAQKLQSYKTYQTTCDYTFSFPYGGEMSLSCIMSTQQAPDDTICNMNYLLKYIPDDQEELNFSAYYEGTHYFAYEGKTRIVSIKDKPNAFKRRYMGEGYAPAIYEAPQLFSKTPQQLGLFIEKSINDKAEVIQKPDTLINDTKCLRFNLLVSEKQNSIVYYLAFNEHNHQPVACRTEVFRNGENEFSQFTSTNYSHSKINDESIKTVFSETYLKQLSESAKATGEELTLNEGDQIPDWTLPVLGKNKELSSTDLIGKHVLLEITATWCYHCRKAVKGMNIIEESLKDNPNVAIISMYANGIDKVKSIEKFNKELNGQSTIVYSSENLAEKLFRTKGYPRFLIISPDGKILKIMRGYGEGLEQKIIEELQSLSL